jgi:sugar O-acyltransferase (sialic acid O-acetyltransferase NeuD family)
MGHAAEVTDVLDTSFLAADIVYFDDVTPLGDLRAGLVYPVLRTVGEAARHFEGDPSFVVAVGGPEARRILDEKLTAVGGRLCSLTSERAFVSPQAQALEDGANFMPFSFVGSQARIGRCVLVNVGAQVHHDCTVGPYCDLGPGAIVAGGAVLGERVTLGAGAVVLPGVSVGAGSIVGAGGVLIHDVAAGSSVAGVPARSITRSGFVAP